MGWSPSWSGVGFCDEKPAAHLKVWPEVVRAFGTKASRMEPRTVTGGGAAAAMWLPPSVHPDMVRLTALAEQHAPSEQADLTLPAKYNPLRDS